MCCTFCLQARSTAVAAAVVAAESLLPAGQAAGHNENAAAQTCRPVAAAATDIVTDAVALCSAAAAAAHPRADIAHGCPEHSMQVDPDGPLSGAIICWGQIHVHVTLSACKTVRHAGVGVVRLRGAPK